MDRGAWRAAVHGVAESAVTQQLNSNKIATISVLDVKMWSSLSQLLSKMQADIKHYQQVIMQKGIPNSEWDLWSRASHFFPSILFFPSMR